MEWMLMPYKRYADFSGRSRRKEYWMFTLFMVIVYVVLVSLGGGLGAAVNPNASMGISGILLLLFVLGSFIPALAVQVRRFHDQGKSGWWVLLGFIPLGGLIVLVFMCLDGDKGDNEYGPDPKGGVSTDVFE